MKTSNLNELRLIKSCQKSTKMPYDTLSSGMSLELRKKKGNILWGDRDGMGASIYSKRKKKESK